MIDCTLPDGSIAFRWGDQQFRASFSDGPASVVAMLHSLAEMIQKSIDEGTIGKTSERRALHWAGEAS